MCHMACAQVTLRVLRSPLVNCTLPVELIYQEDDPRDPPDDKIRVRGEGHD
jgi:hypothetical protein